MKLPKLNVSPKTAKLLLVGAAGLAIYLLFFGKSAAAKSGKAPVKQPVTGKAGKGPTLPAPKHDDGKYDEYSDDMEQEYLRQKEAEKRKRGGVGDGEEYERID